jgi:hypothetical protein
MAIFSRKTSKPVRQAVVVKTTAGQRAGRGARIAGAIVVGSSTVVSSALGGLVLGGKLAATGELNNSLFSTFEREVAEPLLLRVPKLDYEPAPVAVVPEKKEALKQVDEAILVGEAGMKKIKPEKLVNAGGQLVKSILASQLNHYRAEVAVEIEMNYGKYVQNGQVDEAALTAFANEKYDAALTAFVKALAEQLNSQIHYDQLEEMKKLGHEHIANGIHAAAPTIAQVADDAFKVVQEFVDGGFEKAQTEISKLIDQATEFLIPMAEEALENGIPPNVEKAAKDFVLTVLPAAENYEAKANEMFYHTTNGALFGLFSGLVVAAGLCVAGAAGYGAVFGSRERVI